MASLESLIFIALVALLILISETLPTTSTMIHGGAFDSLSENFHQNLLWTVDRHQVDDRTRTRRTVARDQTEAPSPSTSYQNQTSSFSIGSILGLFFLFCFVYVNELFYLLLFLYDVF